MLAVWKNLRLVRQIGAATIDQVNARQVVFERNLLGPQMLLHRHWIIGAAFDRSIIADDHTFAAFNAANAGDDASTRRLIIIHIVRGERPNL